MRLGPLFEDGALLRGPLGPTVVAVRSAGELDATAGLVIADPWELADARPIASPRGRGRVDLAIVCADAAVEVAAERLALSDARTVAWRRADPPTVATDSAMLAVVDGLAAPRLARTLAPFERRRAWVEAFAAEASGGAGAWARRKVGRGAAVLAVTGRDGGFPVWIGRDERRAPTAVVVDLGALDARALARLGPTPPLRYGPELHTWLEAVGARFGEPLVAGPAIDVAARDALARAIGAAPLPELAAYYDRATPFWGEANLDTWHALARTLPDRSRGSWWPVVVRDEVGGVVARADDAGVIEVADMQNGAAYLAGADLRSFFVNQVLTLFGEGALAASAARHVAC
jgi:hypothetical protein